MSVAIDLKLKKEYTLEELFEAIKDQKFTAGEPSLTKHGPATLITFPALDSHNQVQIIRGTLFDKTTNKFTVQRCEAAGLGNVAINVALDVITDGWANKRSIFGSTAKESEELVDITAEELEKLGL